MKSKNKQTFKNWYVHLPGATIVDTRNAIIDACGISISTFYDWINNPERINPLAQKEIMRIARIKQADAAVFFKQEGVAA